MTASATCFIHCVPTLLIGALTGWSYYAYVVQLCVFSIKCLLKKILFILIYHILFLMTVWAYLRTMCHQVASVPKNYKMPLALYEKVKLSDSNEDKNRILERFIQESLLIVLTRTYNGYVRYCNKCKHVKPDRAHHCAKCKRCILKMDHHCPWVNNCIGFSNYKYFVLLLFYTLLYCIFMWSTMLEYFIQYLRDAADMNDLHIVVAFVCSIGVTIMSLSLLGFHVSLLLKNETTLEHMRASTFVNENYTFNIGRYYNFKQVFGDKCILWLIPVNDRNCDQGFVFPIKMVSHPV